MPASPLLVGAAEAARLISLHQPPQTADALTSLCKRLVAELVQVAAQFEDIAASTHLAARSYGLTETALLDRITVLDQG